LIFDLIDDTDLLGVVGETVAISEQSGGIQTIPTSVGEVRQQNFLFTLQIADLLLNVAVK